MHFLLITSRNVINESNMILAKGDVVTQVCMVVDDLNWLLTFWVVPDSNASWIEKGMDTLIDQLGSYGAFH